MKGLYMLFTTVSEPRSRTQEICLKRWQNTFMSTLHTKESGPNKKKIFFCRRSPSQFGFFLGLVGDKISCQTSFRQVFFYLWSTFEQKCKFVKGKMHWYGSKTYWANVVPQRAIVKMHCSSSGTSTGAKYSIITWTWRWDTKSSSTSSVCRWPTRRTPNFKNFNNFKPFCYPQ